MWVSRRVKSQVLSVHRTSCGQRGQLKRQVSSSRPTCNPGGADPAQARGPRVPSRTPHLRPEARGVAGTAERLGRVSGLCGAGGQWQPGLAAPRPRGGSFLARKGAIVCSYSWYVRPQAVGAPPPESLGQGRLAEAGRMRAGEHLPAQIVRPKWWQQGPGRGPERRGWAGAGPLLRAATELTTFEVPRSPGSRCAPLLVNFFTSPLRPILSWFDPISGVSRKQYLQVLLGS